MKTRRVPKTGSLLEPILRILRYGLWAGTKFLTLLPAFFTVAVLQAQDTPVPPDTLFLDLKKQAELAINRDFIRVKELGYQMQDLGRQHDTEKWRMWGAYFIAEGMSKESPLAAQEPAEQALAYFREHGRPIDVGRSYQLLGNIFCNLADFKQGIEFYKQARPFFEENPGDVPERERTKRVTAILANIGLAYTRQGLFEQAADYLFEAEKNAVELEDSLMIGSITNSLGNVFFLARRFEESRKYYRKCYELTLITGHAYNQQVCMTGIGNVYFEENRFDSAAWYAARSLELAKSSNNSNSVCISLSNLANIYGAMGDCNRADSVNRELLQLAQEKNLPQFIAKTYYNLAACAQSRGRYQESIRYAEQSLELKGGSSDLQFVRGVHELLSDGYEKVKNHQKALEHYREYKSINDSLLNESSVGKIQELQTRYETEKKEREIERLSEANRIQQLEYRQKLSWLLIGLIGLGLTGAVLFFYNRQKILLANNQKLEVEQRLLRAQMNPHFIFNALASIQTFLLSAGQADKAAFYLSKFAKLIRRILEHSRETFVPLSDELETLGHYLALQQLRFDGQFDFQIAVDPALDPEEISFPPMLLQPAVENAIEHGQLSSIAGGRIDIEVKQQQEDRILIRISDNGIGRKASEGKTDMKNGHRSLAGAIIRERIALLQKTYRQQIRYGIEDGPESGTVVTYNFPLQPINLKNENGDHRQ